MDSRSNTTALGRSQVHAGAFSLLELLCVVAIIAIMAALLLPALERVRAQAKRVACVHDLQQVGVAFHTFAHDHNGQFPMQSPTTSGGSLEFARNSYQAAAEFYFGFRHFQALSNELVTPKLLVCPTDTRVAAANWPAFKNENLSYCVGINAQLSQPGSILAADRNLTNDWATPRTLQRLGPNHYLRWTHELHRFRGNVLFADGHVEQWNGPGLVASRNRLAQTADLVLPTTGRGNEPITVAGGNRSWRASQTPNPQVARAESPPQTLSPPLAAGTDNSQARAKELAADTKSMTPPQTVPVTTVASVLPPDRVSSSDSQPSTAEPRAGHLVFEANTLPRAGNLTASSGDQTNAAHWFSTIAARLMRPRWILCLVLLALLAIALMLRKKYCASPKRPPS